MTTPQPAKSDAEKLAASIQEFNQAMHALTRAVAVAAEAAGRALALFAEQIQAAAPEPCGVLEVGVFGQPVGPCVRRAGHPEAVHLAADGASWHRNG